MMFHTIKEDTNKKTGVLSGTLNATVFEIVREMPGRKKWVGRELKFEMTRANVEYLKKALPDAKWETNRLEEINRMFEDEQEEIKRKAAPRPLPPEAANFRFKRKPIDYQLEDFHFMKDKPYMGILLEQGLGKTKEAIDIAAYKWSQGEIDTLFIVAPNGVQTQWIVEGLEKDLPDWVPFKAVVYQSEQTKKWLKQSEEVFAFQGGLRIFAMNRESTITPKGEKYLIRVLDSGKAFWVYDESLSIGNPSSQRTKKTLKHRFKAKCRAILDGAPIGTGVENLYSQLAFLHPDVLGFSSFYSFRNRYCETRQVYGAPAGVIEITGYKNLDELQERMKAYCVRRTAAECLGLPERVYSNRYVELTKEQARMYAEMQNLMITQVETGEIATAEQAVVKLMRLQQILCGYIKDEDGTIHQIPSNRPSAAKSYVEELGKKCLIWARFHQDIDILNDMLKKYNPVTWDGRASMSQKLDAKDRFINDKNCGIFIANQQAAGRGLDGLQTVANHMLYYSNEFSGPNRWQSEARLYRRGAVGSTFITDLIVPNTVDQKLVTVLLKREETARTTLDPLEIIRSLKG